MAKKKVLYLHGFRSNPESETLKKLIEAYGYKFNFVAPRLVSDPSVIIKTINETIKKEKPSLIIGSSMGGFYSLICDSGEIPIIAVNPCINPQEHLKRYLNEFITNEEIERFKMFDINASVVSKSGKIRLLLATDDEVLGNTHIQLFNELKKKSNIIEATANFGHRAYPNGIPYLCELINDVI